MTDKYIQRSLSYIMLCSFIHAYHSKLYVATIVTGNSSYSDYKGDLNVRIIGSNKTTEVITISDAPLQRNSVHVKLLDSSTDVGRFCRLEFKPIREKLDLNYIILTHVRGTFTRSFPFTNMRTFSDVTANGQWSPWGQWSECCGICGSDGTTKRNRRCIYADEYCQGAACPGKNIEIINCTIPTCPTSPSLTNYTGRWRSWSTWSNCIINRTMQTRNRKCIFNGSLSIINCDGESLQAMSCPKYSLCPTTMVPLKSTAHPRAEQTTKSQSIISVMFEKQYLLTYILVGIVSASFLLNIVFIIRLLKKADAKQHESPRVPENENPYRLSNRAQDNMNYLRMEPIADYVQPSVNMGDNVQDDNKVLFALGDEKGVHYQEVMVIDNNHQPRVFSKPI